MKSIINPHNKKILNESNKESKLCNCKKNTICPFNKKCLLKGVYKETITKSNETKEYIGSTGVSFKTRFNQNMHSFKPNNSTETTLSKYLKKIEDKENVKIQWTILHSTNNDVPLKPENCSICNLERLAIDETDRNKTLNTRNELATVCPHHKSS